MKQILTLQEALAYARSNCQSYNVLCEKENYNHYRELSYLDKSNDAAMNAQANQLEE